MMNIEAALFWPPLLTNNPGACFSKVPKTFRARKAIRKTTTSLFCKAGLFIRCKGNKNQNNCKVSCLETPSFWRYEENYGTRNTSEKFRDFRETGPWPWLSRARTSRPCLVLPIKLLSCLIQSEQYRQQWYALLLVDFQKHVVTTMEGTKYEGRKFDGKRVSSDAGENDWNCFVRNLLSTLLFPT